MSERHISAMTQPQVQQYKSGMGAKVLIVDDEVNNIMLLETDLIELDYQVLSAKNGHEALELLRCHTDVRLILLDRMMPIMNGMQFLEIIKKHESLKSIPIIMQTAAAQPEQLVEAIDAGVYYYLTKPYNLNVLRSIVTAAIDDANSIRLLRQELADFKGKLGLITQLSLEYQTLEEARYISTFISRFFPDPDRVILGLFELLVNAVEHGNLKISYDEKTQLNSDGLWIKEVQHRLSLPEYKDLKAKVIFKKTDSDVMVTIQDQGVGFNWQEYLELSAERGTHSHGRGIAMSKLISFDQLQYFGVGNEVECRIFIK